MPRAEPPKSLLAPTGFGLRFLILLPLSLALHAVFLGIAVGASIFGGSAIEDQVQYVSVITLPAGSPNAGSKSAAKVEDLAPPPTPPPPVDDSMIVPQDTPKPASSPGPSASETPDPRLAALDAAKRKAARDAALAKLAAAKRDSGKATPSTGEGDGTDRVGVPGGDWNVLPGAVPYEALVRATIESNWLPPTWIIEKNKKLTCSIHIKIGFDGRVVSRTVVGKSGEIVYDASALAAIDKTERLPIPPEEVRDYLLEKGITLRFNPRAKL